MRKHTHTGNTLEATISSSVPLCRCSLQDLEDREPNRHLMIQSLDSGSTSPVKRQMKEEGELSMCDSPKRKRLQVETKSESVSALSAKAWAFSIDAIITRAANIPMTSSETSDSEDWPQNEDELRSDPGLPVSSASEVNYIQLGASWSHQTHPGPRSTALPTYRQTSPAPPPIGEQPSIDSMFVDKRRPWTIRDCDTPPLKTAYGTAASPRTTDNRCSFRGGPNSSPSHNQPDSRMEPPKGSSSICRVSKGTGDLARVRCQLETRDLWTKFNELGTEMIITKSGRRMFPVVRVSFTGLKPATKYLVLMDIVPVDSKRYRYAYHRSSWLVAGKADPDVQQRCYVHPDAPFLGDQLSKQAISFEKLKLTNNVMDKHGYIILNSMHKYQPRIHLIKRSAVEPFLATPPQSLNSIRSDEIKTFEFPETVFIAVTAYQNQLITKLKIDCNPFAKGFRDSARLSDFERESMETLLATHTGTGGVIASLSNQFRSYIPPGTERGAGLEVVAADETTVDDDDIMPSKHTLAPTSLHPSVLHQLTEVLSSPSKTHALYRKPSDGEELLKRLHSLQRHYDNHHPHRHPQQQQHQQGIPTNTHGSSVDATASAANSLNQRICLGKLFSQPASGTFQGSSLKPIDLSGTGTIREKKEEQHLPPHWLASRRLPLLPADRTLTSPAAAMLTYLHLIQQIHGPLGGPSGSSFLLGKPVEGPRVGSGTTTTQAPVVSTVATPIFASYRQLREDAARLAPTLATPTLMK